MGKGDKRRPCELSDEEIGLRYKLIFSKSMKERVKARLRLNEIDKEKKERGSGI